jgi:L,D-transpeptidase YcbB
MAFFQQATLTRTLRFWAIIATLATAFSLISAPASYAQSTAFKQAVALAAAKDPAILEFYKARNFKPIWTGGSDRQRRRAFLDAASKSWVHGLPTSRYNATQMKKDFGAIKSAKARGILEVETSKKFLQYAQDIQSGILEPLKIDKELNVFPPRRDRMKNLVAFSKSSPTAFIRALPPKHPDYQRLLKEKARLEKIVGRGGWGDKVPAKKLKPGQSGKSVVAMRKRLKSLGYKKLGTSPEYNEVLQKSVQLFQVDHGLNPDGIAGVATIKAMNISAQTRLQQVIVGLERQRWLNKPRGKRHIFVNQADFRAYVMDNGKPTLETRVVVGKAGKFRTPEFSDEMTHLIINPTWHVPKSIARKEYLPMLKKDPTSLTRQGLRMTDVNGRRVDPTTLDYTQYDVKNFPFDLKQPPSTRNALGLVKFMFPNRFNIYLHDTPSKSLFARDTRAYSHGCVRVQKPFELAYTILKKQSSNPKALFHKHLDTGRETVVDLEKPIPVHLVYHTAWVTPQGRPNYRGDTYGRDKRIFKALVKAGVVLRAVRS